MIKAIRDTLYVLSTIIYFSVPRTRRTIGSFLRDLRAALMGRWDEIESEEQP